jgi:hypothetical protein
MLGQTRVEEGVVRKEEIQHAAVGLQHMVKNSSVSRHRGAQAHIESGEDIAVGPLLVQIAQIEPLARECASAPVRADRPASG